MAEPTVKQASDTVDIGTQVSPESANVLTNGLKEEPVISDTEAQDILSLESKEIATTESPDVTSSNITSIEDTELEDALEYTKQLDKVYSAAEKDYDTNGGDFGLSVETRYKQEFKPNEPSMVASETIDGLTPPVPVKGFLSRGAEFVADTALSTAETAVTYADAGAKSVGGVLKSAFNVIGRGFYGATAEIADTAVRIMDYAEDKTLGTDLIPEGLSNTTKLLMRTGGGYFTDPKSVKEELAVGLVQFATGYAMIAGPVKLIKMGASAVLATGYFSKAGKATAALSRLATEYPKISGLGGVAAEGVIGDVAATVAFPNASFGQLIDESTKGGIFGGYSEWYKSKSYLQQKLIGGLEGSVLTLGMGSLGAYARFNTNEFAGPYMKSVKDTFFSSIKENLENLSKKAAEIGDDAASVRLQAAADGNPEELAKLDKVVDNLYGRYGKTEIGDLKGPTLVDPSLGEPLSPTAKELEKAYEPTVMIDGLPTDITVKSYTKQYEAASTKNYWGKPKMTGRERLTASAKRTEAKQAEATKAATRLQNEATIESARVNREITQVNTALPKVESELASIEPKLSESTAKVTELKSKLDEAAKVNTEVSSKVESTASRLDDLRVAETELRVKIREAKAAATDITGEGSQAAKDEAKKGYRQLELQRDRKMVELKSTAKELRKAKAEAASTKAILDAAEVAHKEATTQAESIGKLKETASKQKAELEARRSAIEGKPSVSSAVEPEVQSINESIVALQEEISKAVEVPEIAPIRTLDTAPEMAVPSVETKVSDVTPVTPKETAAMPSEMPQRETKATDLGEPHTFTILNREGKEVTVVSSDPRAEAIINHYRTSIRGKGTVIAGELPTESSTELRKRLGLENRDMMASYAKMMLSNINKKGARVVDERLFSEIPDFTLARGMRGSRRGSIGPALQSVLEDISGVLYNAPSKLWNNHDFRKVITNKGAMILVGGGTRIVEHFLSGEDRLPLTELLGYASIGFIGASLARRFIFPMSGEVLSAYSRASLLKELEKTGKTAVDSYKAAVNEFRSSSITGETRVRTAEYLSDLGQSLLALPRSIASARRFIEKNPDILSLTTGTSKLSPDSIVRSLKGIGSKAKLEIGAFDLTSVESVASSLKLLSSKIESGLTPEVIKDIFPSDSVVAPFVDLLESAGVSKDILDGFRSSLRLNDIKAIADMHSINLIGGAIDEELDTILKKSVELSRIGAEELSDRDLLAFHSAVAKHKLFYSVLSNSEDSMLVAQAVAQKTTVLRSLPDDLLATSKVVVDEIKDGTKAIIRRLVDNSESEGIRKLTKAERNAFIGLLGDNVTVSEALADFTYQSLLSGVTTPIKAMGTNFISAGTATANNIMEGFAAGDLGIPMKFAEGVLESIPQALDNTLNALLTGKSIVDPNRTKAYIRSVDKAIIAAETGFNSGNALGSMLSLAMNHWVKEFGATRPTHWALAADEFTKTMLNSGLLKKNLHVAAKETAKGDASVYKQVIMGMLSGDSNFSALKTESTVAALKEASKYTFTDPLKGKLSFIEKMWRDNPSLSLAEPIFVTGVRAAAEVPRYIGAEFFTDTTIRKALLDSAKSGKINSESAKFLGRLSTGAIGLYTVNKIIHSDPDIEFSGSMLWDSYAGSTKKVRGMKPWSMRWGDKVYDISDTPWSKLIGCMVDYQQMSKYIEVNESALSNEEKATWYGLKSKYAYGMAFAIAANVTPDSLRSLAEKVTGYQHKGKGATYKEISKTATKEIPNEILSRFIPVGFQQALSADDGIAMAYTNDFTEKLGFFWDRLRGNSDKVPRATDFYGDPKKPNSVSATGAKRDYKNDRLLATMEDIGFNASEFDYRRNNIGGVALSASQKEDFMKLTGSKIKKRKDQWVSQMDRIKSKSDKRKFLQFSLNNLYAESVDQFLRQNKKLRASVDLKSVEKDYKALYDEMED